MNYLPYLLLQLTYIGFYYCPHHDLVPPSLPTERKLKGRRNKTVVGTVVKSKIGELEEEVRAGNSRRTRKDLNGMVKVVSGRRRFLVRFQNGCKNILSTNQLTVVIVEKIPEEKEPEVSKISEIPEEQIKL